jgi:chorismate dehydratase
MIRLGHIEYSNCFPVHSLLLDGAPPEGVEILTDIPARLNAELAAGRIDVAPCSSIEFARHAGDYVVLPGFAIASDGPVGSILFECAAPLDALDGSEVWVPTASATSVVLLRVLLELRHGVRPRLRWFDQAIEDPFAHGASCALFIGDVALRRVPAPGRAMHDLGEAWTAWTGLPFAFAIWQANARPDKGAELRALHALLGRSLSWFDENTHVLAERHAARFGVPAERLERYWRSLVYTLDDRTQQGLLRFFELAARLGEAPLVDRIRWLEPGP